MLSLTDQQDDNRNRDYHDDHYHPRVLRYQGYHVAPQTIRPVARSSHRRAPSTRAQHADLKLTHYPIVTRACTRNTSATAPVATRGSSRKCLRMSRAACLTLPFGWCF